MILFILCGILGSPADGILTDPGPLCAMEMATLTCNLTGGVAQQWTYNGAGIGTATIPLTNQIPAVPAVPIPVDGVEFRVSLLSTGSNSSYLATQIAFVGSERMDGRMVECATALQGVDPVTERVTLQVGSASFPGDVRLRDPIVGSIGQSTATIEWPPPTNGGNDVIYTIGATPAPVSGAPVNTRSTHTTITVAHNINYTVTVGVNTCAGVQENSTTVLIVGCPIAPPPPVDGSILPFPATNEGAEIVYHCVPGFQPQRDETAVCASNGRWTPDPALHECTADCGYPVLPSDAAVLGTVSSTTEGANVSFQCEEGLILPDPINITCIRTGSTGQWTPNPQDTQCRRENNIIGVVVPVVTVTAVVLFAVAVVIMIICWRNKSTSKEIFGSNDVELQKEPVMEYSTLTSRGYETDTSPDRPTSNGEYSFTNWNNIPSSTKEVISGGLVYADIGSHKPKKSSEHVVSSLARDKVVYASIATKATAQQRHQQGVNSADASLDLNMLLLQVRAVIPNWYQFGEALGVSEELLKEVQGMRMEDYDKLVEVLDCWFRNYPVGSSPTWRDVAVALQSVGFDELSSEIMKVYTTGQLPISVSDEVPPEAYGAGNEPPPPLPPKEDDFIGTSATSLPPKPTPRMGSLKNTPPRPPKTSSFEESVPPRPPKNTHTPARPPKPSQ